MGKENVHARLSAVRQWIVTEVSCEMLVCSDCVPKYVSKCIRSFGGILAAVDQCHHAFPSVRVLSTSHIFPHRPCFFWLSLHKAVSPLQSICLTQVPEIETASAASLCVDTGPGVHPSIHPSIQQWFDPVWLVWLDGQ